jgi:hypothetical protein
MNAKLKAKIEQSLEKLHYINFTFDLQGEMQLIHELSKEITKLDTLVNELECEKIELEERLEVIEYQQHQNDLMNRDY